MQLEKINIGYPCSGFSVFPVPYYNCKFPSQDYRNEVGEILVADRQLAEEIEFDLKMLEEEQKKAAAARAATTAVSTPQAATPHAQMVSS